MRTLMKLLRRLRTLIRSRRFERELDEELRFHLETRIEDLEREGVPRAEAERQARRELGSTLRACEESREAWQFRWIEDLFTDLRLAWRALIHSPAFSGAAILSFVLGIGANTTIFSLTMEFLFSEPSCRDCGSLAAVRLGGNSQAEPVAYRFLQDSGVFASLTGYREEAEVNWLHSSEASRLPVMRVASNYFEVTGAPLMRGRGLEPGESTTVVVAYDFWRGRLAEDPDVLGRTLVLDGRPLTIVGVLPREHRTLVGFGFAPTMYLPALESDDLALIARIPAETPRPALFDRLRAVATELDGIVGSREFKLADNLEIDAVAGAARLRSATTIPLVAFFSMLMAVVGLVLLIACINVASLLLARASTRRQELAVRLALGAGRGRVVRQLLAESLLLAGLGAAGGLALNVALTRTLSQIVLPLPIPIKLLIEPDWRLLLYATALGVGAAVVSGLLPALQATRRDVQAALQRAARQVGHRRWDLRKGLVVGQIAISFLLLAGGALFLRNLQAAAGMHPGFDVDRLVWAFARLTPERYDSPEQIEALAADALGRLRALPGVEAASLVQVVPFNDNQRRGEDVRTDIDGSVTSIGFAPNRVGPDYFRTMGIPILSGRELEASDLRSDTAVAVVNQAFARRLFGEQNPVGRTIWLSDQKPRTIVGLAGSIKHFSLGEDDVAALYEPYEQAPPHARRGHNLNLMIRSRTPTELVRPVADALAAIDPLAALEVKPMSEAMGLALLPSQAGGAILGAMGVLGLALAAIGLHGVIAYAVSRRVREIGVRSALGARPRTILWLVLRQGAALSFVGMALGAALSFVAKPVATQFLVPQVSASDPAVVVVVVSVLGAVAVAATLGPALRAVRVDPTVALRSE